MLSLNTDGARFPAKSQQRTLRQEYRPDGVYFVPNLAALIQGSRLEIMEGGHMASSGSSPEVRRRILDFFEE